MIIHGTIGMLLQWTGATTIGLLVVCSLIRFSNLDNINKRKNKIKTIKKKSVFIDVDKIA